MVGQEYIEHWEDKKTQQTSDDVDESTLEKFFKATISCGRMPQIPFNKRRILTNLGVLKGNYLSNAGVCLFSKQKPLSLKMGVFATEHRTTLLDIVLAEGNIFELIEQAVSFLLKNMRWRVEIPDNNIQRIEIPEVPIKVLREAVVNSFVHAKYDVHVHHEIDIFSNRISVCNPGCFANKYQPIDYATRDIHSYLRNEVIAKALYLSNNVETFGSGIKNIYKLCNDEGITVSYTNEEEAFTMEFSRRDRNSTTLQNRDYEKQKQIDIVSTRHSDSEINGKIKPGGEINGEIKRPGGEINGEIKRPVGEINGEINRPVGEISGEINRPVGEISGEIKPDGEINGEIKRPDGEINGEIKRPDGEINGEIKRPDGEINGDQKIKSLSADELLLLNLLMNNPAMTNPELAASSGKSPRTVSRILSALKRKKLLTRVGSNKTGFWVLP